MSPLELIAVISLFNFAHFYGFAENRFFREAGALLPCGYFKVYHGWMALISIWLGGLTFVLLGNFLYGVACAVYFPLGLDVVWWIKRYLDFTRPHTVFRIKRWDWEVDLFYGRELSEKRYRETNAWHERDDWDNNPLWFSEKPPLVGIGPYKVYLWWWIFSIATAGLLGLGYLLG